MSQSTALTRTNLKRLQRQVTAAKTRAKKAREETRSTVRTIVHGAETISTSFGMGFINGYWGEGKGVELLGAPLEVVVGLTSHFAGFLIDDDMSPHLHAIGTGALSAWAAGFGTGAGVQAATKKTAATPSP